MRMTFLAGVAALALLAGCTTGAAPGHTLAQAQAESVAILAALQAGASVYTSAPTTTPAESAAVEKVMQVAETAVGGFQNVEGGSAAAQLAEESSQAIEAVLSVLPIDPVTKTAIDAGLAVIDGTIAGLMTQPSGAGMLTLKSTAVAPVPIPAPRRDAPRV
ncbi:MAG: hypothetical protein ACREFZ_00945 [Acetobacteraceae bacterium]